MTTRPEAPSVGENAPPFRIRSRSDAFALADLGKQPVVLAFLKDWSPFDDTEDSDAMRAELRGLGAVLVVLSRAGLFVFRADDDAERFALASDLNAGDVADVQRAFGLEGSFTPGLFLIDSQNTLRFAHAWRTGEDISFGVITSALGVAGRTIVWSGRSRTVTRRELAVTSIVAGFGLVLLERVQTV